MNETFGPMYEDYRLLSAAHAMQQAFEKNDQLRRPEPNLDTLAHTDSSCRSEGRKVQLS